MGSARPVKARTAESFAREVEQLTRLRTALKIKPYSVTPDQLEAAVRSVDELIEALAPFIQAA